MKKFGLTLFLFSFVLLLTGCGNKEENSSVYQGFVEGTEIPILTEIGGTLEQVPVEEGSKIKKGDLLARLDQRVLEQQVKEAQASLAYAQSSLEELEAGARDQELQKAISLIEQNQAQINQLEAQQTQLHELEQQRLAQWEQVQAGLQGAESTVKYEQDKLTKLVALLAKGVESKEKVDAQKEVVDQASAKASQLQAQIKSQQAQLQMTKGDKEAIQAQIQAAKSQKSAAEAQFDLLKEGATANKIKQLIAQRDQAEARLEQVKIQKSTAVIVSPANGTVIRKNVSLGEVVKPSYQLMSLLEEKKLEVKIYVPEAKLGDVVVNQQAVISVDAFPERSFKGVIQHISEQAEFTPKNVQTPDERTKMVFAVTIKLQEGWDQLRPGMPADVSIAGSEQ
ncbi:HlyD family secretion protein [Ammoniphilus resinae]|uniref:HlyD family secretion protein n=1 Tax=Ammoniphilus resinae TaxID=861532 RepID=A0ABS4GMG2_9BACL|nr:efflux RND transporter periplasmic adaptor subunit [Ammoniphilus resinae]MBP1931444.1 HlyD family secretion protein [Ammoniphilus resinae]